MRWALAALLLAACGDGGPITAAERGRELFSDPSLSASRFNEFSCATCHRSGGEAPWIAWTLEDVAGRTGFWGGYAPTLLDAVNQCLVLFMRGAALGPGDERGRALYEYLVSISPGGALPQRPVTVVENITTVPLGDPARGERVYQRVCRGCHGRPHTGIERLSDLVAIIPEASIGFAAENSFDAALVITEKVRHGQSFGVGGTMPFFAVEALSDGDLGAVLAYLGPLSVSPSPPAADDRPAVLGYIERAIFRPSCATASCHSEHAKAGNLVLEGDARVMRETLSAKTLIFPGQPAGSPLLNRLRGAYNGRRMPPDGPLPEADIELIERWIAAGAP